MLYHSIFGADESGVGLEVWGLEWLVRDPARKKTGGSNGEDEFWEIFRSWLGVGWTKIREVDELGDFGGISSSKS